MEREQEELRRFINLHASKAALSAERRLHLATWSASGVPLDVELATWSVEDVFRAFSQESMLVRWTMRQLQTYDVDREIVIGLDFGDGKLLAHVVRLVPDED